MGNDVRFLLGDKAEKLYFSVLDETSNRKHFPVKFRRLADRMQEYALDIHSDIMEANGMRTDSVSNKVRRYDTQTRVITRCSKFMSLVKYCLHAKLIGSSLAEQWAEMINDVKYMTLAWRKES